MQLQDLITRWQLLKRVKLTLGEMAFSINLATTAKVTKRSQGSSKNCLKSKSFRYLALGDKKILTVWLWANLERCILGVQAIRENWAMQASGVIRTLPMSHNLEKWRLLIIRWLGFQREEFTLILWTTTVRFFLSDAAVTEDWGIKNQMNMSIFIERVFPKLSIAWNLSS
jgi:hypothetical protein